MSEAKLLMQFQAQRKSPGVAYFLLWFFWWAGAHRFYLGRGGSGFFMLVLFLLGVVCL